MSTSTEPAIAAGAVTADHAGPVDVAALDDFIERLELVDHHCHAVTAAPLDRLGFELLLGESGRPPPRGCSAFDTNLGLAVRTWCAPVLDLPAGAGAQAYLERRSALGTEEVNARLLASGARELLVDTGYRSDELADIDGMRRWAGGRVHEIARLEGIAESVAAELARAAAPVSSYADKYLAALEAKPAAAGWKSVAAYRGGLALDWRRPGPGDVREAAAEWLAAGPVDGPDGRTWRLTHPVLIRHGVWTALDTGRPVQIHTGFGDTDASLLTSDPSLLSDLLARCADLGTPVMLLHCWPHHRQAGYLANVWPHVYVDVGLALPHTGHRGSAVFAETLELAPWHKVLYSSDAFGLAELFHLGAMMHRRALLDALRPLAAMGFDAQELVRLAALVAGGNARRVYPALSVHDDPLSGAAGRSDH